MIKKIKALGISKLAIHLTASGILATLTWYITGIVKIIISSNVDYKNELISASAEYCAVTCSFVILLGIFCDAVMRFSKE